MLQRERTLTLINIDAIIHDEYADLAVLGTSIKGLTGLPLLKALKRDALAEGPYPGVTLFEAANRVMTDLVILHGVAGLLKKRVFPFSSYTVEFGHENFNNHDIQASNENLTLVGEAFNVAESFFTVKKGKALKKLRNYGSSANIRLIMVNEDAVNSIYSPKTEPGLHYVFVNIDNGQIRVVPTPQEA